MAGKVRTRSSATSRHVCTSRAQYTCRGGTCVVISHTGEAIEVGASAVRASGNISTLTTSDAGCGRRRVGIDCAGSAGRANTISACCGSSLERSRPARCLDWVAECHVAERLEVASWAGSALAVGREGRGRRLILAGVAERQRGALLVRHRDGGRVKGRVGVLRCGAGGS